MITLFPSYYIQLNTHETSPFAAFLAVDIATERLS